MTLPKPKIWSGYMDGYLKNNLNQAKEVIQNDWDMVFCVDGYEGTGKSVLAQQCAKFCDESFDIERICFTPKEFTNAIKKSQKHQSIVYDEAYGGMSSRAAMSEVNRSLMSVLAEIRQKNLFVFIVLPCFFELDKYAAVWRSRALLHVYTGDKFERGRFSFYNQDRKKILYVFGKKFYSYKTPAANFFGRFTAGYVVDEKEYRARKLQALCAREEKKKEEVVNSHLNRWKRHTGHYANYLINVMKVPRKTIAEEFGLTLNCIKQHLELFQPYELPRESALEPNKASDINTTYQEAKPIALYKRD